MRTDRRQVDCQALNVAGVRTRNGRRLGGDAVHKVLTRTTYGAVTASTKYWKTHECKPEAVVVEMAAPPIIDVAEFEAVQTLLVQFLYRKWRARNDSNVRPSDS
ncbi:recombinase family protein [Bradyrhizobium cosmicum]|uniref:recombinase family protein n=1 Tax=Bradyrhizobium cosmicum TaxID=1404864 RepID=UPI0039656E5B